MIILKEQSMAPAHDHMVYSDLIKVLKHISSGKITILIKQFITAIAGHRVRDPELERNA